MGVGWVALEEESRGWGKAPMVWGAAWGHGATPGTVGDATLGTVVRVVWPWGHPSVQALTGWWLVTLSWEPAVEVMWVEGWVLWITGVRSELRPPARQPEEATSATAGQWAVT